MAEGIRKAPPLLSYNDVRWELDSHSEKRTGALRILREMVHSDFYRDKNCGGSATNTSGATYLLVGHPLLVRTRMRTRTRTTTEGDSKNGKMVTTTAGDTNPRP